MLLTKVELWSDRTYSFTTAPSDILGGAWTYWKGALETRHHAVSPPRPWHLGSRSDSEAWAQGLCRALPCPRAMEHITVI